MADKSFNVIAFIKEDIWLHQASDKRGFKALPVRALKVVLLSIKGFTDDLCLLRSSALTLYSLLSIVPVFAMLFGIAKGFGFEQMLKDKVLEQIPQQDGLALKLLDFAENMLISAKGGVVAGIGIVVLVWTVIKVIGNIEESFNAIWKIKQNRPLSRKLSDYLSLMFLAPVLLILSGSITVFVQTQITWLMGVIKLPEFGTWLILKALSLSPTLIMSALFSFLFIFMPNHKIELKAGIIAGVLTGVLYQTQQWIYLSLQIGVSGYNAIYGSFAALPLFIVSLQLGWIIVLFGCEVSFFLQNFKSYRNNSRFSDISFTYQKAVALQIMQVLVSDFIDGKPAATTYDLAVRLELPVSVVQSVMDSLQQSALVDVVKTAEDEDSKFRPGRDSNRLSVAGVIEALERRGEGDLPESESIAKSLDIVEKISSDLEKTWSGKLLRDL
ncbi:MAG: YhjD/YihY/BrkB family envelope integrity protein [Gammaproteobacteria bacterium]